MTKPSPCMRCLNVADADYFWTNRLGGPWPFEQATVALCVPCFIEAAQDMTRAYLAAMEQLAAHPEPGLLEQAMADADHDDGIEPAPRPKSRPKKEPEPVAVAPEASPQAEAPDE